MEGTCSPANKRSSWTCLSVSFLSITSAAAILGASWVVCFVEIELSCVSWRILFQTPQWDLISQSNTSSGVIPDHRMASNTSSCRYHFARLPISEYGFLKWLVWMTVVVSPLSLNETCNRRTPLSVRLWVSQWFCEAFNKDVFVEETIADSIVIYLIANNISYMIPNVELRLRLQWCIIPRRQIEKIRRLPHHEAAA